MPGRKGDAAISGGNYIKSLKNIPASVRQRLLNRARSDQRPFNELLQYYAMERFLYRLSQSSHTDRFILKGALMLRVWRSPEVRPTMDIDMLGRTSTEEADLVAQIRDILAVDVEATGLFRSRFHSYRADHRRHGLRRDQDSIPGHTGHCENQYAD